MTRGVLAFLSGLLFVVGIAVTLVTWNPDGWAVLGAIGFAGIVLDVMWEMHVEAREAGL